jgi:hypothetical protein
MLFTGRRLIVVFFGPFGKAQDAWKERIELLEEKRDMESLVQRKMQDMEGKVGVGLH